jgi:hypothetical protein
MTLQLPKNIDPKNDTVYVWAKAAKLVRQLYNEYPNTSTVNKYKLKLDPNLIQSFKIIKKLEKSNPTFMDDMHINNLMIRRTPIGPQLVINDPLATNTPSL